VTVLGPAPADPQLAERHTLVLLEAAGGDRLAHAARSPPSMPPGLIACRRIGRRLFPRRGLTIRATVIVGTGDDAGE
jgi:hypothetical protein